MNHPKMVQWDNSLKRLFDEIDDYLEDTYGGLYPLHPNRPSRGKTSNKEHDGLFNVGAFFTPGFGSSLGRGYVVDVEISTLNNVLPQEQALIEDDVVRQIKARLPRFFPDRELHVQKDGRVYKIWGDLSLGNL